jgi:NAD(P)-dependent dehydrogenase (short-subunit alcohol dehydrogenase family)
MPSMEPTDFSGGVAVITGAGSGLGHGLVERAVARGMRVVLADIDFGAIERRSAELNGSGATAIAVRVDVSRLEDVERLAELAYGEWGRVDLLVNNAGIEAHGLLWELDPEVWDRVLAVNLNGVYYGLRSFLPRMLLSGSRAHIINVASVAALGARPHTAPYGASKHGCLALTEIAAKELAGIGADVVVSAALPGPVRSSIFANAVSADADGIGARDKRDKHELISRDGMDPSDAAEIILDGASRGVLRIHTHPEASRSRIEERWSELADFTRRSTGT